MIITIALLIINIAPLLAAKRSSKDVIGKRRRILPAALVCMALIIGIFAVNMRGAGTARPFEGQTLHIYNWGEYTGENIIGDFEEETGATVVMENFDSNEQMYIKAVSYTHLLISNEVCNAVGETEEERAYLMSKIMPKLVVGGLACLVSVLVAGVMAPML